MFQKVECLVMLVKCAQISVLLFKKVENIWLPTQSHIPSVKIPAQINLKSEVSLMSIVYCIEILKSWQSFAKTCQRV